MPLIYRIPEDLSIDQRKMFVHSLIRRHSALLYNPEADEATQFSQRYYTLSTLEDVWLRDRVFTMFLETQEK